MTVMFTSKGLATDSIKTAFLLELHKAPVDTSVCIITTAAKQEKASHPRIQEAKTILHTLGIVHVDFLDVECEAPVRLLDYDCLYLAGGDPVHLLKHLRSSGADELIQRFAHDRLIVGVSAGSLVFGPHLKLVHLFTPHLFIDDRDIQLTGLGLIERPLMPHADRDDLFPADTSIQERLTQFEQMYDTSILRLPDDAYHVMP